MFHFAAYRLNWSYEFRPARHCINSAGFPHSEIFGSKRACRSPKLIAACCVLHRLMSPRHPSIAVTGLCKLTYSRRLFYLLTLLFRSKLSKNKIVFCRSLLCACHQPLNHSFTLPCGQKWWAQTDLNHRPCAYQAHALTN